MTIASKRLTGIVLGVALLLSVPLIAMQFTTEVAWTASDFAVAGMLLLGTGLLCEWVLRKARTRKQRIILCLAVLAIGFLIWAELAVGLFGTPLAGN